MVALDGLLRTTVVDEECVRQLNLRGDIGIEGLVGRTCRVDEVVTIVVNSVNILALFVSCGGVVACEVVVIGICHCRTSHNINVSTGKCQCLVQILLRYTNQVRLVCLHLVDGIEVN